MGQNKTLNPQSALYPSKGQPLPVVSSHQGHPQVARGWSPCTGTPCPCLSLHSPSRREGSGGQGLRHGMPGLCLKQPFPEMPHLNCWSLSPSAQLCPRKGLAPPWRSTQAEASAGGAGFGIFVGFNPSPLLLGCLAHDFGKPKNTSTGFTLVSLHLTLSQPRETYVGRGEQLHPHGRAAMSHVPTGDNRLKQDQNPKKPQSITE